MHDIAAPDIAGRIEGARAVIFDAGNTLAFPDWTRISAIAKAVSGRSYTEGVLRRGMFAALSESDSSEDFLERLGRKEIPPGWHYKLLFANLGFAEAELEVLLEALAAAHAERHLWSAVNPEAEPLLKRLKARGQLLAVISNSEDGQVAQLLRAIELERYFDLYLDSYVFGAAKPDPRIFREAVSRLGVEPSDAVYVGDMFAQDVAGANLAGLQGVLYDPLDLQVDREHTLRITSLLELMKGL